MRNRPEGSFFDMHGSTTIALTFLLLSAIAAQAQSFDLLYTFRGSPDSNSSSTSLVQDAAGNLYGTAGGGAYGLGTVFKLDPSGTETVLHSFAGGIGDGEFPQAGLRLDKNGNLYGTTNLGGKTSNGVVFKIDPTGNETIVYNFAGGTTDGCYPLGGLVMDKNGRLYGTTNRCGTFGNGTVFRLTAGGKETTLHSFAGGASDGENPYWTTPIIDQAGNLYGVAFGGGTQQIGVVYKLSPTGVLKVLHSFTGGTTDGCYPFGNLAMDNLGNLYGAASACGAFGYGTVWELNHRGNEKTLHNFSGPDGEYPRAGVVRDANGNLYGDAQWGGAYGLGTVYRLSPSGRFGVLHTFNATDGEFPLGDLLIGATGTLYGTTSEGGSTNAGTIWSLK